MIISGVIISSFISLSAAYDKADVVTSVNHEGTRVVEQMTRIVRSAQDASQDGLNGIILQVPPEQGNLEYKTNGNCTEVKIYLIPGSGTTPSSIAKTTDNCSGTSVCPVGSPCILTSTDVNVVLFAPIVTEYASNPDIVLIKFDLQQKPSLSNPDPETKTALKFERSVSTRGY